MLRSLERGFRALSSACADAASNGDESVAGEDEGRGVESNRTFEEVANDDARYRLGAGVGRGVRLATRARTDLPRDVMIGDDEI